MIYSINNKSIEYSSKIENIYSLLRNIEENNLVKNINKEINKEIELASSITDI